MLIRFFSNIKKLFLLGSVVFLSQFLNANPTSPLDLPLDLTPELTQPENTHPSNEYHPSTINVFCEPPAGGFGDVASNLLMAQLLADQYPQAQINIIFSRTSEEAISRLVKLFQKGKLQQTIGRFNYFNLYSSTELPLADILFQFSSENVYIEKVAATAPLRLVFTEFVRNEIFDIPTANLGFRVLKVEPDHKQLTLILPTGIDNGGIYLSPQPTNKKMADGLLASAIYQTTGQFLEPTLFENSEIGFVYVSESELTEAYNQVIYNIAKKNANKSKTYLLFSKETYHTKKGNKPDNVIYIPINNFSLELSREIIQRASLPIFITGDVSLNFAIDATIPFFYEQQNWKLKSIDSLQNAISQLDPELGDILDFGLHIKTTFAHNDLPGIQNYFEFLLENSIWQFRFQTALARIRSGNSLIENIGNNLQSLEQMLTIYKTQRQEQWQNQKQFQDQSFDPTAELHHTEQENWILSLWSGTPIQRGPLCSQIPL